jgi:RHS repeat-associated protein
MHPESGPWSKRLSSLLIFAILLELIAPAAWALPSWDAKPKYPQGRRHRRHHSDPLVRKALSKTVPSVGEAPPGTPEGLTPQSDVSDETEAQDQGDSTPPASVPQDQPAPSQVTTPDEVEEHGEQQDPEQGTSCPELAVLLVDPRQTNPPYEVARQSYADGPFKKPEMAHSAHEVYINDYAVHVTQKFEDLTDSEDFVWLCQSPNETNNAIHLPEGECAAAMRWRYRASGANPSDLKSKYSLEVKVWSAQWPHGKVVFQRQEATKLCCIQPHYLLAPKDVGDWWMRTYRNGNEVAVKALEVQEPPQADEAGISRHYDEHFAPLDEGAAYTSDDWLHFQKSYTPKAPNRHGRQDFDVEWNFKSPNAQDNSTKLRSALSLTENYRSDGTQSVVTQRIYDALYPKGHTYQKVTSSGRLGQVALQGGPGLARYGNWKLQEKVNDEPVNSQTVPVRKIAALLELPAGNIYQNNGNVAYQIRVATFPADWNPRDIGWKLRLRNGETQQLIANYEGIFLADPSQPVRTFVQPWDGLDEETGQKPPAGTMVVPQLEVNLLTQDAPVLSQARVASPSARSFGVQAAVTQGDWYHLAGEIDNPIGVDDDLYIYLDDEQVPVWSDDDGVSSYVTPRFQANKGQRVRMVAVDSFGLCRNIDGPIYLYHEASGQRQLFRRFKFDDGCYNWPAGFAFLDIFYTILIPSNQATPISVYRATTLADCFPNIPQPDREFINRNTIHSDVHQLSSCTPIDNRPNAGVRTVSQIDTANDTRGKDVYFFPNIKFCSPIPLDVDPTTGHYSHRFVDLSIPTRGLPLNVGRNYVSEREQVGPNFGWSWDFEEKLELIPGASQAILKGADGTEAIFVRRGPDGQFDPLYRQEQTEVLKQLDDRHYEVTFRNQTRHVFEIPSAEQVSKVEAQTAVLQKKIDRNNNALTYLWSTDGRRLNKIQGPVAAQYLKLNWSKGDFPRLEQVADHTGRCVQYQYTKWAHPDSASGYDWLLSRVIQPGCTTFDYTYHPVLGDRHYRLLSTYFNGTLQEKLGACDDMPSVLEQVSHHDTTLAWERFSDENGRLHSKVTKSGSEEGTPEDRDQVTESILDNFGRVIEQIDPAGQHNYVEYDIRNNITATTDSGGFRTEMDWDTRHNLLEVRNALSQSTRMSYDSRNNVVMAINAKGEMTQLSYDDRSNLLKVIDNIGHQSTASYDANGLLLSVTNNQGTSWTFAYDALGFLTRKTVPGTSAGQAATTWNYLVDTLGRTLRKTDPLGRIYNAKYDERDRLFEATVPPVTGKYRQESQCSRSIYQTYDNWDRLRASKALDGRVTRYDFDDCDQLVAVFQPGYPKPIRMEYDAFENLVKMTNVAGQSTHYRYDVLNRSVEMVYPNSDTETFHYDNRSNLVEWNRGGQVISYAYDELSRLLTLDSPGTGDSLGWEYDELGRVKKMRESSGAETYMNYTDNDLVASILRSDGKEIRYGYDSNDRLEQVLDQQGESTQYAYNERNEVTRAEHDGQTVSYQYDPVGRRIGSTLPNGIQCRQEFDERNRLLYLNYQKGARPVLTYKYGHNQLGQRIVEEKTSAEQCKLTRYCFNARRELIQSDRRVGNGCGVRTNYRYDLNHNRIGQNQYRYQHNAADQLLNYPGPGTAATLAYNAQGQANQVGDLALTYNQSQQIKTAQNGTTFANYQYDASGRRMAKEVNGEREEYLMLGQEVLKTFDGSGQVKADYFLALGREGLKTDGSWKFYLSDGLGSTALLTDDSGNTVAAYDYEDYGATTQIAGDAGVYNPYRYTGQEWDAELGMYNLRARHYSPSLGRFLARDPIGYGGGTNLVAYCQADPIDYADPSGLRPTELNFAIKSAPKDFDFSLLFNDLAGQTGLKVTYQFVSGGNYTGSHPSDSSTVRGLIQFDDKVVESMDQNGQLAGYQLGATLGRASHIHRGSLALFTAFRKSDFEAGIAYWMGTGLSRHQADCKARYYLTTNAILHEIIHIITGINDIDWNNMKTDLNYPWFTTSKPYTEIGKINASFLGAIK